MLSILDELNDAQREVVLYNDGPSMVVAGAGSGKTRVLTYKITYLLSRGYEPHRILALTFTNKAAREMKDRIAALTNERTVRQLWAGTFHSIFYRILREEAEYVDYNPDFTIYDATDSRNLIRSILREMQLDEKTYRPGLVQSRISNAKNALVTAEAYGRNREQVEYDARAHVPLIREIYARYQNRCRQAEAMDFDELLLQTNILFRDHPEVLDRYQRHFRFVLVDEYQDTNLAQHAIVNRLCEKHRHICVVGDDAQSIYSFRGANIDNMLRFKDTYPEYRLFKLERNYRSTRNIVEAANSLIDKNKGKIPKNIYSENEAGSKIRILSAYNDTEEAYQIATQIMTLKSKEHAPLSEFAVLYRTNAQSRVLEEALRKKGIAYRVYGGQSFYQRKEVKDIIAYFRVVVNPDDEEALKRIINYPARGIGETTVTKLMRTATEHGASLWAVVSDPAAYALPANQGTLRKLGAFHDLIQELRSAVSEWPANEMAELIIKRSGIAAELNQDRSAEGISRQENMQEVPKAVREKENKAHEEGADEYLLSDFLREVSLQTDQDEKQDESTERVTLMTVHAAKGLEFDNVIIAGMEENLFPSQMAMDSPRAIEEERRLFYVALTRARRHCLITYAKTRFRNGMNHSCTPSHFLDDIDPTFLIRPDDPSLMARPATPSHPAATRPLVTTATSDRPSARFRRLPTDAHQPAPQQVDAIGDLHTGDTVRHDLFGTGTIVTLEGEGGNAKVTVDFEHSGRRSLLLKYARLTPVKD